MNCENRTGHPAFFSVVVIGLTALLLFLISEKANAQTRDSIKTGYLPDAAEEHWPAHQTGAKGNFSSLINYISIRNGKGFISIGVYLREFYELFDNYLWGRGPQDNNGYFLHRAIVHSDFRYNENFRVFAEMESSLISDRNGGARPVQDLDKLAIDQVFGEYSFRSKNQSHFSFRFGKQALNYGVGSLLDIRETNVRRSFFGAKFIIEDKNTKIDFFAMDLMKGNPGVFDDKIDHTQKIAGAWLTQTFPGRFLGRLDAWYLYTHHDSGIVAQGTGNERRNTVGMALNFSGNGFTGYTEADLQFGKFNNESILAWKIAQTVSYKFGNTFLKPGLSLQSAISSGDHNLKDSTLDTFNPLYPKAIYYGYIDNVGSANIMLVHIKIEVEPAEKFKLTAGYYSFWRESTVDGLYGATGALLVSPGSDRRHVGSMYDLVALYTFNGHCSARAIGTYYKRGAFLQGDPTTPHDVWYLGITTTLRL